MDKKERDPCEVELEKVLQLCDEKNADPEVKDAVARARKLVLDRDRYCGDISSQHSAPLTKIIDDTFSHPFDEAFETGKTKWRLTPRMCSGTLVGNFLQSIVSMSKAKRVLEIGTFTGYMALACAEVLPADGVVVTCEFDPYLVELAGQFFQGSPHKDKIQIRQGDAKDTLRDLAKERLQFDIVFIDANKDGYLSYFKAVMESDLLAQGGTILLDNTLFKGFPYAEHPDPKHQRLGQAIKECNEYIQSRSDIHRVLLPIRDGVLMVRRRKDMFHLENSE